MKHVKAHRRTRIVALCLLLILSFSAMVSAGLATSPLGVKPLAGLGSCPLGAVTLNR
jgi:hypothetical protein